MACSLGTFPARDLEQLPTDYEGTVLYRIRNEDRGLLYVGIANNVQARMYTHSRTQYWWRQAFYIECDLWSSRADASEHEHIAIMQEHPAYNKVWSTRHLDKMASELTELRHNYRELLTRHLVLQESHDALETQLAEREGMKHLATMINHWDRLNWGSARRLLLKEAKRLEVSVNSVYRLAEAR